MRHPLFIVPYSEGWCRPPAEATSVRSGQSHRNPESPRPTDQMRTAMATATPSAVAEPATPHALMAQDT